MSDGELLICTDCGAIMTDEERYWYGYRCEACEGEWADRITKWRNGAADAELDLLYSAPAPRMDS